ncbi:hypothetical protein LWI28_012077 [Acer negundo]|uniref:Uncharacterized protein n=1 Tax=Acer negundo TaxID=4023 RepID=A0AAD5P1V1_ACENE|nr:hypothetical protein LWI28_012077 [Acer negundo]
MKGDGSSRHGWKRTTTTTCGNRSGEKHELEWREKREMLMKDEMRCDYVRDEGDDFEDSGVLGLVREVVGFWPSWFGPSSGVSNLRQWR